MNSVWLSKEILEFLKRENDVFLNPDIDADPSIMQKTQMDLLVDRMKLVGKIEYFLKDLESMEDCYEPPL